MRTPTTLPAALLPAALLLAGLAAPLSGQREPAAPALEPAKSTARDDVARPIAFDRIERRIEKLPELRAAEPLYGLLLFGLNGEDRVWAVLDKSAADRPVYDVLWLDLDADGALGEDGERFDATKTVTEKRNKNAQLSAKFEIGEFTEPTREVVHDDFTLTWTDASIRMQMRWRGDKKTFGVFGPTRDTYVNFRPSVADAPILVPGYDRPFEFEHWMSGTLRRGRSTDFKVFVGNRGDRTGAFLGVDDEFLPPFVHPIATLIYTDTAGAEKRVRVKLTERC